MEVKLKGEGPVIIVDDSKEALKIAEIVFEDSKIKNPVLLLQNGTELLTRLEDINLKKEVPPALILLDINMPSPNGFETLQKIRTKSEFQEIPVVMLTSSNDSDDMAKALANGADGYQVKPFGIDEFIEFANSLLP